MAAAGFTLFDVVKLAAYQALNFEVTFKTLDNPSPPIKTMIDICNQIIVMMAKTKGVPWAQGGTILPVSAGETTSVINFTKDSKTVSGAAWSAYAVNPQGTVVLDTASFGTVPGDGTPMRFVAATSDNLTLNNNWPFASVSSGSAVIFGDHFRMPSDFDGLISASFRGGGTTGATPLKIKSPREFYDQRFVMRDKIGVTSGTPQYVTILGRTDFGADVDPSSSTDHYWVLAVDPPLGAGLSSGSIDVVYKKAFEPLASSSSEIPVPDVDIDVLVQGMVVKWNSLQMTDPGQFISWTEGPLIRWAKEYNPTLEPQLVDKMDFEG